MDISWSYLYQDHGTIFSEWFSVLSVQIHRVSSQIKAAITWGTCWVLWIWCRWCPPCFKLTYDPIHYVYIYIIIINYIYICKIICIYIYTLPINQILIAVIKLLGYLQPPFVKEYQKLIEKCKGFGYDESMLGCFHGWMVSDSEGLHMNKSLRLFRRPLAV